MPIVSFWNPVENTQTSSTSSIVAVASMLLWKSKYKTLITQTHFNDFTLEQLDGFWDEAKQLEKGE